MLTPAVLGRSFDSEKPIAEDVATANQLIKTYNDKYKHKGILWRVAEVHWISPLNSLYTVQP